MAYEHGWKSRLERRDLGAQQVHVGGLDVRGVMYDTTDPTLRYVEAERAGALETYRIAQTVEDPRAQVSRVEPDGSLTGQELLGDDLASPLRDWANRDLPSLAPAPLPALDLVPTPMRDWGSVTPKLDQNGRPHLSGQREALTSPTSAIVDKIDMDGVNDLSAELGR